MELNKKIIPINKWFNEKLSNPVIIAGPCSAESESQLLKTAIELSKNKNIKIFRAGVWKPRTRPGSFEGAGSKALKWLEKVKETTGLKIAVEVATPEHIKECEQHGIDIFWIGARTTSNPFSVQQIAENIQNTYTPILIKNPINPDIELWTGAIERLLSAGINKIAAVHRGFYPFEKTTLRNIPKWEIPIELMIRFPELSVICDPSHISGNTKYIKEISQKAFDLSFNGLMIESHCCPKEALSDKKQQLEPFELFNLLNELQYRKDKLTNGEINILESYRSKIDSIDFQLLELLSQRMNIVEEIGEYKSHNNLSILQLRRWKHIIESRLEYGNKLNLDSVFIKNILKIIHDESIKKQAIVASTLKKN